MYSKNGSIPKPQTDGTEGWIEVEDPPVAGDGEEVVWWYPPGWVVRPVKPADEEGIEWNWSQSEQKWVAGIVQDAISFGSGDASTEIFVSGTASSVVDFGSARPE